MIMTKDFSIVKIGGRQYKVSKGDLVSVEKLDTEEGKKATFTDVFLSVKKGKVSIGVPAVKGAKVEAKVVEHGKGKKINIFKYKSKTRYRRRIGHRQPFTKMEITKI